MNIDLMTRFDNLSRDGQVRELRRYKASLGFDNRELSRLLNVSVRVVEGWSSGRRSMPGSARRLIGVLCFLKRYERDVYDNLWIQL